MVCDDSFCQSEIVLHCATLDMTSVKKPSQLHLIGRPQSTRGNDETLFLQSPELDPSHPPIVVVKCVDPSCIEPCSCCFPGTPTMFASHTNASQIT